MGQTISQNDSNKSNILNHWLEMNSNTNIIYNKITNQQIQRHEIVIRNKSQINSYIQRMQDQTSYICRLIYFHPKINNNNNQNKKINDNVNSKIKLLKNQLDLKTKNTFQEQNIYIQQKINKQSQNNTTLQNDNKQKIHYIYTDRMIPIKQWNKQKIIHVFQGFKKLVSTYGLFKVKQNCLCQNQCKQVKVWINQIPVINLINQKVQSEEDMIADFASILVSKKQKIVKELLDFKYFDQVIHHFTNLFFNNKSNYQNKSHSQKKNLPNMTFSSNYQMNNQKTNFRPEINNFYNVFINTDNSFPLNNTFNSSKFQSDNNNQFDLNFLSNSNNLAPSFTLSQQNFKVKTDVSFPHEKQLNILGYQLTSPNSAQVIHQNHSNSSINKQKQKKLIQNTSIFLHSSKQKQNYNLQKVNNLSTNSHSKIKNVNIIPHDNQSSQNSIILIKNNSNNKSIKKNQKNSNVSNFQAVDSQKKRIDWNQKIVESNSSNFIGQIKYVHKQHSIVPSLKFQKQKSFYVTQPIQVLNESKATQVYSNKHTLKIKDLNQTQYHKKSFPKYYQQSKSKSISKFNQKIMIQKQKLNILGKKDDYHLFANNVNYYKSFVNTGMPHSPNKQHHYNNPIKDPIIQMPTKDQFSSHQILLIQNTKRKPQEQSYIFEHRKKFPSTIQYKKKYPLQSENKKFNEYKKNQSDKGTNYQISKFHLDKTTNNFSQTSSDLNFKCLKNSHTNSEKQQQKIKQALFFSKVYDKYSKQHQSDKKNHKFLNIERGNLSNVDENRKLQFPHTQNLRIKGNYYGNYNSNIQTNQNSRIQYKNHPILNTQSNNILYIKKYDQKNDQSTTLPRTTTDQRQKKIFKPSRVSQVLDNYHDLHRSQPGKFSQHHDKNFKQTLYKLNGKIGFQTKNTQKHKKWQNSANVYGSLINTNNCIKNELKTHKKQQSKSQKEKYLLINNSQPFSEDINSLQFLDKSKLKLNNKQSQTKLVQIQKNDNLFQNKKKIRKQIISDYKQLFGDDNPVQRLKKQQFEQNLKRQAKKLQIKKMKEDEQSSLQMNLSSKDLLIQQKVQKQRKKHAQLKSQVFKLFTDI